MARYGRGYYHNLSSLIVGVQEGLHEALLPTAEDMCGRIRDIVQERLYDKYTPLIYQRLEDNGGVLGSIDYRIDAYSNEVRFFFNDSEIRIEPQECGTAHKYLLDGYTTDDMMEKWSRDNLHDDILFAIKQLLFEFPKIYRENCKAMGLYLN